MATKQTVYAYSISHDFQGVTPDSDVLAQQIVAAGLVSPDYINTGDDRVEIAFPDPLSDPDKATLDGVVAAHALPVAKTQKCDAIDAKTQELIDAGFVFAGRTYALDGTAYPQILNFDLLRLDLALTYPVVFNSLDNTSALSIANAIDLHTFFLTAFKAVRSSLDSGTALKYLVRAAATVADVEAIVDPR